MGWFGSKKVKVDVKRMETEKDVDGLIEALGDGGLRRLWSPGVRRDAADALGKIDDERAVEPLIKALSNDDWNVRLYAAAALGEIGDARAVEPLIKALEGGNSAAAVALGRMGTGRAVRPLIKALKDDDWGVQRYTARALGEIGDACAVESLIEALGGENEYVREAAKEALRKLGHEVK